MFHQPKKSPPPYTIKLNKIKLQPKNCIQYLGVLIDENLAWNNQISVISSKLSRANGILSKLRYYVPEHTCLTVYYSLFYSCILYGSLVWSFTNKTNIDKLTKLQRKCIRIITFSDYKAPTDPLFIKLKILKIEDVFTLEKLKLVFDYQNESLPEVLSSLFTKNVQIHTHLTRGNKLHIPSINTTHFGIWSLRYNCAVIWNQLNNDIGLNISMSKYVLTNKFKNFIFDLYESTNQ